MAENRDSDSFKEPPPRSWDSNHPTDSRLQSPLQKRGSAFRPYESNFGKGNTIDKSPFGRFIEEEL